MAEDKRDIAPTSMHFVALAADYDGTIAHDGVVALKTCEALKRLKLTGRRLFLVTGRTLPSVKKAFSGLALFDRVVAENGAVIYDPATEKEKLMAPAPSVRLVEALHNLGVTPLTVGSCVISTWEPHQNTVLEQIQALGLELQIIFNKGAVMVLPRGVDKASGLSEALRELEISCKNVMGVGDAENDLAFLRACGCAAAVANALPAVKAAADIRLSEDGGIGVIELVDLMSDETAQLSPRQTPERHRAKYAERDLDESRPTTPESKR